MIGFLRSLWKRKQKQQMMMRFEFPLIWPHGGSAGRIGAVAANEVEARMLVLTQVDPGKVIVGPAECMGPMKERAG